MADNHINNDVALEQVDNRALSKEETQKILTPFAFKIDSSLFGLPLARPWRRASALLIDFLIIAVLAETPGELFALLVAITFYKLGSKNRTANVNNKRRGIRRALLRVTGAFILFIVLIKSVVPLINNWTGNAELTNIKSDGVILGNNLSTVDKLTAATIAGALFAEIETTDCQSQQCFVQLLEPKVTKLANLGIKKQEMKGLIDGAVEEMKLSSDEQKNLTDHLMNSYSLIANKKTTINTANDKVENNPHISAASKTVESSEQKSFIDKLLVWTKDIIKELGVSFGWAALYFSVLTAIWRGQTPGKKLLKIRVVQLDGTPLSVWDSFGRYGGYGAGLATGLLGFLQIYWDPNRQCIHDKISSTVVVDLKTLAKMKNS